MNLIKFLLMAGILLLLLPSVQAVSYLHGNGLAAKLDGELEFYHADSLGSTRAMTDELGAVIEEQKSLPFGGVLEGDEKYGFTGKELDESGLQYFGARYYDSGSGRFLSTDPALQYHSPYLYAGNNPLAYRDSDGNFAQFAPAIPFLATPVGWVLVGGGLIITGFMAWQGQQWLEGYTTVNPGPFNEEYRPASMPDLTESIPIQGPWDMTERFGGLPEALRVPQPLVNIPAEMPDMSRLFAKEPEQIEDYDRSLVGERVGGGRRAEVYGYGPGRVIKRFLIKEEAMNELYYYEHLSRDGYPLAEIHSYGINDRFDSFIIRDFIEGRTLKEIGKREGESVANRLYDRFMEEIERIDKTRKPGASERPYVAHDDVVVRPDGSMVWIDPY